MFCLGADIDTDPLAIHGLTPITNIFKIFISWILLHYRKYNVFYALPLFENLKKQDL